MKYIFKEKLSLIPLTIMEFNDFRCVLDAQSNTNFNFFQVY